MTQIYNNYNNIKIFQLNKFKNKTLKIVMSNSFWWVHEYIFIIIKCNNLYFLIRLDKFADFKYHSILNLQMYYKFNISYIESQLNYFKSNWRHISGTHCT